VKTLARADVVVPVYRDVELTRRCALSVLEHSGQALRRLILVDDASPEPEMRAMLRDLRDRHAQVRLLENEENLGFVGSSNRGLSVREGDVVLLNSDAEVTPGWLDEVLAVLHAHPRIAAVTPLSNNATLASVPRFGVGVSVDELREAHLDLSGLPRWTETPTGVGFCLALRDDVLSLVGLFDPAYGRGYNEENDWCQRARALGFLVVRANRCLVFHHGEVSFQGARAELDEHNARRLVRSHPTYLEQNRDFERGPHARVAAIGVAAQSSGLRVCLDLAHVVAPAIHGTALYGTQLALALVGQPGLELTVRAHPKVREHLQASQVRCVAADAALVGFDLVHKPSQVYSNAELGELLAAEGHLVFTWQDLIALRSPPALGDFERWHQFRSVTWAALSAAQGVLAISGVARAELLARQPSLASRLALGGLGAPVGEVPDAVDVRRVRRAHQLPARYVVHTGSDYPHKNLELLLEAWPLVSASHGVELVLAGPPSNLPGALYTSGRSLPRGVRWLGELDSADVLPVLRGAALTVLPSVYEGFGLGVLEAMACEVPVVVMAQSAGAEVAGDAALTLATPSPRALAEAIEHLLSDAALGQRLVEAGTARLSAFSWETTGAATAAFYRQVAMAPDAASLDARDALRGLIPWTRAS